MTEPKIKLGDLCACLNNEQKIKFGIAPFIRFFVTVEKRSGGSRRRSGNMNKIYKVVWSKVKHCYVVTSELAKRQTKGCGVRSLRTAAVTMGVAAALLGAGHPLFGMPVAEAKTTIVQHGNKIVNTTVDYTTVFNFLQYPEKSITVGETEIYEVSNAYGVFGNVAQRMGKKTTDIVSFKVVDGQLIEVHNVTMSYVVDDKNPYQRVLAVHPFNYSKGTDAEIDDEIKNSDGAKADVSGYTVTMTGGSLQEVTGGLSNGGKVSNNTVNLNGGTAYKVYGGYTVGGAAETNHVVLNGGIAGVSGTIVSGGELYGAYSYNDSGNSGNVTGNTVTVDKSGIVMAPVYGGSTEAHDSGNASGNAVGNIVTINGGTLAGNIYGGYSDAQYKTSGNVEGNQVIIKDGVLKSAPVTINGTNYNTVGVGNICGGYTYGYDKDTDTNASGIAKDNEVTISGGTFRSDVEVAGGYSNANNAEHNIVNIESTFTGTVGKVTGGEAGGNGTVTKNEVTIAGGTVTGFVTAGISESGNVQNNEVTISGGTVGTASASPADEYAEGVVYGAYSVSSSVNTGDVTGNAVTIKSGTVGNTVQAVIGGFTRATGSSGNSGKATGNTVTIEGGTIAGIVRGGASMSSQNTAGEVKENSVIIKGGELKTTTNIDYEAHTVTSYRSDIYGGYLEGDENSGVVQDNTVTISGGDFTSAKIYGGYSNASNAVHNTVEFTKDFTAPERNFITVAGGASISGNAIKNVVAIGGGNIGRYEYNVYGGYSETGTAGGAADEGNTVTITGGKVEGSAVGGFSKSGAVKNNVVTVSGSETEVSDIRGGSSWTGTVSENTATIQGGWVGYAYGGFSSYDTANGGTANGNKLNISGGKVGGGVYGGDAPTTTYNAVTISGDAEINTPYLTGGRSYATGGVATGNTFTILGGTFSGVAEYNYSIVGGFTDGNGTAKDNAVNLTGEVTGLENFELYGYVHAATHSGNELHIGGTKIYDSEGNATVNSGDVWQGKNSDGTVNNKVESVSNFERIVLHNVAWNTTTPALEAATVENVGTLDIKDLKFDQTPTSGSMALLKSESILGAGGVGIGLAYKDGSTEKTATSADLATGVTFDSDELVDKAVNGVSLTGTQSKKVSLEDEDKTIMYSFSSSVDGITIATDTFTAGETARSFGSGVNLTGATITNNLAFSPASKKNMASGTSMVILDATEAVAVSGATLPTFDATTYDVDFSDAIDSKVVTLSGKHTDTLAMNSAKTQLVYTVGDKNVAAATFEGAVDFSTGDAYYTADSQYKFGATNVDAKDLTFNKTTEALAKDSSMTLLSATGLTAGTITQPDAPTVAINYGGDATNGITFNAVATGSVAVESGAMKFKVNAVEAETIDLSNWNGTTTDVSTATSGWTLKAGETVETGDLAKADLSDLKLDGTRTILTASNTVEFTNDAITGNKKWKEGGTSIAETSHKSGVVISAGETTGSGVKVNENNAHQLIYQQGKNNVTGITLGKVTFNTAKAAREFGNAYDLTAADIDATNFKIKDAETAAMNAGEEMIVLDATKAIKGTGTAALKDFDTKSMTPIDFSDDISGTVLTFAGNHTDTLEQNAAKTQIVYKVGDKNVETVTLNGSVKWDDSKAYYTNDATKYKFATTNVDADKLTVTGTTTKLLKADGTSSMTLLSATGMTAGTITDQSADNKAASKVSVNYKDDKGVAFAAEAKGAVTAEAGAVKYNINEVKLTDVDLSAWTGSESSVPDTWTAEDGSVKVATGSFAEPDVAIGSARTILTAGSAFFADDNISGANKYDEANGKAFSETQNNVTVSGTQAKGVAASEDSKSLVYKVDIKKADTVTLGATNWQKGATLFDGSSATEYDYANVTAVDAGKFDVTYASPETVAAGESLTLLKANETLTAIINEEKAKAYSFSPVSGVTVDAAITGKLTNSNNNVVFTAAANQASKLTFGDVEWKDSGALLTRPRNITFAGADVDTSRINFTNMIYLDADRQMTLVSDFGDKVGTITGSKYLVGTAFEGEGAASLSGSDLVFRTKTGAGVSEQTHKTVMATEVGVTMLNTGNDYIDKAMEGMGDLANVAPDGTTVGAAIGGGRNRYETGSHVNVNSWNAAVAVGAKRELKNGSLEYGVFGEYGKANFTLHSDAGKGDGDSHYAGGGLLAKWTNKHDVYTEASFRLGRLSESSSDIMRDGLGNTYGYDVHANYYGAHVGVGKIFRYNGGRSLDVYGKYFYTKRDGVEFDAVQHYNLDSVASSVLRIGARYGTTDKKWNWYGGLAYEYEFDGEAEGVVNGVAIRAASIKGSSVRGEIGMRMNATKTNPWQTDISIYGYGGKHRGFGGNVNVAYMF